MENITTQNPEIYKHYTILETIGNQKITAELIKSTFKDLAKVCHPDNTTTGDKLAFQKLSSEKDELLFGLISLSNKDIVPSYQAPTRKETKYPGEGNQRKPTRREIVFDYFRQLLPKLRTDQQDTKYPHARFNEDAKVEERRKQREASYK
jgi:hypothetical protein